jgi:hypothetical protein
MPSGENDLRKQVEEVVNGLAAELTAQKTILQMLVAHMLVVTPMMAQETFDHLREDVMNVLRRSPGLSDQSADKRVVDLQLEHADRFFRELSAALVTMKSRAAPKH